MNKYNTIIISLLTLLSLSINLIAQNKKKSPIDNKSISFKTKLSYAYGTQIAKQIKKQGLEISIDDFFKSFKTVLDGKKPLLDNKEINQVFKDNMKKEAAKNIESENKFLEENKKKKGIKETNSGLQYEIIKSAKGKKPKSTNSVTVHYHGTFLDGSVFDSSVQRNKKATFPLNQVIKGWTEGLQLMSVGSKYKFYIPSKLAYGGTGNRSIKPFTPLIFEIELFDIK